MAGSVKHPGSPAEKAGPRLVELSAADKLPILAVDDRAENLVALEAVLAPLGVEVARAASGEQALRLLLEQDFALILLDVRMPGLDGIETARLIKARERTREVPIVFLTAARDEVSDMLRGYGVGAVDYVLKPFDDDLLRSKVAVFAELEHRRRALSHSEALLRSAFDGAAIGKTVLDAQRQIVRVNPAFARMVGRDQDELTGVAIAELCHPEDRAALVSVLDREAPEPDGGVETERELGVDVRLIPGARREVWVAPTASWIKETEYTAPLLFVQWVDVGARRRAERTRGELLVEQAARAQAESQAERLEKLQVLLEAIESPTLDDLLAEVARRLLEMFDADASEVRVNDGGDGQPIRCVSGASTPAPGREFAGQAVDRVKEATLTAEGEVIGVLGVTLHPGRSFSRLEHALLGDAANQVSLLVRRMKLQEQEHRIATDLQRGLLPALPELPGVEIAADSRAAGLAAEVGGDWYDAFMLPGDRLGLVIGDVTGSGIAAASAMGQLRSVTRAFALGDPEPPSPAEVLTRVHRYHQQVGFAQLFTVLYVVLDPSEESVWWANAGHPPPLLRTASGDVRALEGSQTLMSLKDVVYEDHRATVKHGDTLILYTDGLVERRGEAIDAGLERLQTAIRTGPRTPKRLRDYVLDSAPRRDTQPDDDVTALVVRIGPREAERIEDAAGQHRLEVTLSRDANAPGLARRLLEREFGELVEPEELDRAKLAVSELTTNAVLHGQGEITLLADLDAARLMVDVIDEGSGFEHVVREPHFEAVGGRGLNIVEAETSSWGMHAGTTHVWFEIERRRPPLGTGPRPAREPG